MVKAMAAHKSMARQGRPAGAGRRPQCAAPDPADQCHGAGRRRGDRDLPDLAHRAQRRSVKNACDKGVMVFAYDARDHRALRLQHLDRPGGGRPRHGRVAGEEAQRQGQHRRDHRRARNLGRHAAHQGGEGGLRQAPRHQDRRRGGRHVEPGGRPHRTLKDPRHPATGTRSTACGCRSAATPPIPCSSKPARSRSELLPCAGEGSNGGRIQMLPVGTEVEGATAPMRRWARRASPMPRRLTPARSR